MTIADTFDEADLQYRAARESARVTITKAAGGSSGPGSVYSPGGTADTGLFGQNMVSATKQYLAAKTGWQFAAIRPAAVKIASQPIRVGMQRKSSGGTSPASPAARMRTKFITKTAPSFVKSISEGLEISEEHPALSIFENPNPHTSGWALKYSAGFSIMATGRGYWWIIDGTDGNIQLWYIPAGWVEPIHEKGRPFVGYRVTPPGQEGTDNSFAVRREDMCDFLFPDPEDPLQPMSPLQTLARAVNTDDEIQKAQYSSMVNSGKPGMVIKAGRLDPPPGMTGQGPLAQLTPEQRKQLISACRMAYSGAMHHGDPIILDAMIEDVYPYTLTPAELDFLGGSQLTKDRIFQGLGTNPIVAGQIQDANRASAYVAHEGFYSLVVNPIAELMSQEITKKVGPRLSMVGNQKAPSPAGSSKLYIWIEEAEASDADLDHQKVSLGVSARCLKKNEVREYLNKPPLEGPEGEELAGMEEEVLNPAPPPGTVGATRPAAKPAGGGKTSGGNSRNRRSGKRK